MYTVYMGGTHFRGTRAQTSVARNHIYPSPHHHHHHRACSSTVALALLLTNYTHRHILTHKCVDGALMWSGHAPQQYYIFTHRVCTSSESEWWMVVQCVNTNGSVCFVGDRGLTTCVLSIPISDGRRRTRTLPIVGSVSIVSNLKNGMRV